MAGATTRSDDLVAFGDGGLTRLPGLDGLRGLAVAAVLCFHGGFDWMAGGWLGVSLFFTLSGFLITSLVLSERTTSGSISLRTFWARRFRRLLPVAWLTIGVVVAVVWSIGTATEAVTTRGDAIASLAQVANWRFLVSGQSYAALFSAPSPLLHFWSLAIEEQFYLLFPLLVVGMLAVSRRAFAAVLTLMLVVSWSEPMIFGLGHDRTYYGTDTRAGELLVGALLAIIVARPGVRRRLARSWPTRTTATGVGVVAGAAMVFLWVRTEESSPFVTSGGLAVHGLLAAAVIVAVVVPTGPLRWLCSIAPLRRLGGISYGIYLFHWPLFVFLTRERTGLGKVPRFVLVVGLALLLAELSSRVLEGPIRRNDGVFGVRALRPAMLAPFVIVALVAGSLALSPVGRVRRGFDAETAAADLQRTQVAAQRRAATTPPPPSVASVTALAQPPVPAYSVFGDSVSLSIALSLAGWDETGQMTGRPGSSDLGCGIVRGGLRRFLGVERLSAGCDNWPAKYAAILDRYHLDLAVVSTGQWETVDRKLEGDPTWRAVGDPVFDARVREELLAVTDLLASRGALVVWLTFAHFGHVQDDRLNAAQKRSHSDARVDRLNQIIGEVVAARPSTSRLVDLAAWMAPRTEDTVLRSDGSHYDVNDAHRLAAQFLGPAIRSAWDDWWRSAHGG